MVSQTQCGIRELFFHKLCYIPTLMNTFFSSVTLRKFSVVKRWTFSPSTHWIANDSINNVIGRMERWWVLLNIIMGLTFSSMLMVGFDGVRFSVLWWIDSSDLWPHSSTLPRHNGREHRPRARVVLKKKEWMSPTRTLTTHAKHEFIASLLLQNNNMFLLLGLVDSMMEQFKMSEIAFFATGCVTALTLAGLLLVKQESQKRRWV